MNTVTDREYAELRKMMVETDAIIAQMRKMNDEREKLRAETDKIQIEAQTFKLRHAVGAFVAAVVFLSAVVGLVKLFLS